MDQDYLNVITNEILEKLPLTMFSGTIHLVNTPEAATRAIEYLSKQYCLGFDTETKPSFKKGKSNPEEFNIEKIKVSNRTNICQVLN